MFKRVALVVAALSVSAFAQAQQPGKVETLPSGVVVSHLTDGSGPRPTASSTVTVHYRGTLESGAEFDSSYKRGTPTSFGLNQVIPCWTEGIQHMAVGGKAVLTCPAETAYGTRGAGGVIPPNAKLRFEVELLGIK